MTSRRSLFAWHLLMLVVVACAGPEAGPGRPVVETFVASPASIEVGASVTLSWTVTGSAPLALSVEPGIGDVTGLRRIATSPDATTTYTLTAVNAAGSDSDQVTVVVSSGVALRGRVIGVDGRPAAGVRVSVPETLARTTGVDGAFDFGTVETPYAITTYDPSTRSSLTYLGLATPNPTLVILGAPPGGEHVVSIYGEVTGGTGFPEPSDAWTQVGYGSRETRSAVRADPTTGGYAIAPIVWYGPNETLGTLHALQWRNGPSGTPTHYTGYGTRSLLLHEPIVGYLQQDIVLAPIPEGAVDGVVDVPPGYAPLSRTLSTIFDDGAILGVAAELGFAPTFDYRTPVVAGATHALAAAAIGPAGELSYGVRAGLPATMAGVRLFLPAASTLEAPDAGATGIDHASVFAWSAPAERVHLVRFAGPPGTPTFHVVTWEDTLTLPDLAGLGLDLPASETYRWQVFGLEPFDSIDAAASASDGFLSAWPGSPFYLPRRDGSMSASVERSFTTAP